MSTVRSTFCYLALAGIAATAQVNPGAPPVGVQAVHALTPHLILIPKTPVPKTGQPLATNGHWSMANQAPAQCANVPAGSGPCVSLFYALPDAGVSCEWVVVLNANATDVTFLDENDDAAHYFMPKLSFTAAGALVKNRPMPVYSPTSQPADGVTTTKVQVLVRDDGRVQNAIILDGSASLNDLSQTAARDWTFKPLKIGNRTVPFQTEIDFSYSTHFNFPSNSTISSVTARP